tara:strand:- start:90 stop:542 length:453 start_codon:yes stop_codon:yes gene_type:complete
MIKLLFITLPLFLLISSCQQREVIKSHGIAYLEKREKLIILNKSNKNDIVKIFGQPASKGLTNNNLWIYIERTKTRGKMLKLGKNYLKTNNVLVLEFNDYGIVFDKKFYNKDNMNDLTFAKAKTENEIKKENYINSFLSSVKQKMQVKRK